jgi:NADH-ubiquinone oxidoreductase chain 5
MLIFEDNFIQLFLGWEKVSFASYLLINFWFTQLQVNKAVIKAMLVNRVSDFELAFEIMGHFIIFQTVNFSTFFLVLAPFLNLIIIIFSQYEISCHNCYLYFTFHWCC